jgi:PhzF family phenazine biosynthesis protein
MKAPDIIYQVDAFTTEPFKGNPAGVCILDREPEIDWMQNIAMEMNLSETAFVFPGENCLIIRYYTPEAEIKLCGHATLSASHIIYETGLVRSDKEILFLSKAGELHIEKQGDWITMNFPAFTLEKTEITSEFKMITGIHPQELYKAGYGWTLAVMKSEKEVKNLKPHFSLMKESIYGDLIVTAPSEDPVFDFCVRCFAPAVGIDEDPVTGSAHCALGPYWSGKTGRKDFNSHQISKREGILRISLKGDRVEIAGQAKTVFKAELFV